MQLIRRFTQIFGYVISHNYFKSIFVTKEIYQGPLRATCIPFLTCYSCPLAVFSCPIGTIQHYMVIRQFPFLDLAHISIVALAVGRMACGWLCPFGLIQDLLYKIKSVKIKLLPSLFYIKYLSLAGLVIIIPYITGVTWFSRLCPYGMLEAGIPWVVWNPINPSTNLPTVDTAAVGWAFVIKLLILIVFLVLFVISKRPFCRIACPLGVIFSVFNKISLIRMEVKNPETCSHKCNLCREVCPMEIKVSNDPNSGECIRCLKCMKCSKVSIGIGNLSESSYAKSLENSNKEKIPLSSSFGILEQTPPWRGKGG